MSIATGKHLGARRHAALLGAALSLAGAGAAQAYTAAGDRLFPSTILLPQIAPSDDADLSTSSMQGPTATLPSSHDRLTSLDGAFDKTITEDLGLGIADGHNWLDGPGLGPRSGGQNLQTSLKYLAFSDDAHEFLMSVGVAREWGGTGTGGVGAASRGATTPTLYLGKGMGDADIGFLRPFAVAATVGYQIADGRPRPDLLTAGLVIEFSVPYLESKVDAVALPEIVRAMTPMVELVATTPVGSTYDGVAARPFAGATTGFIAPGVNYAGAGWELGVEALVPVTRASGSGVGVLAQLHISLDYIFPDSIGRPLLAAR